MKYFKFFPNAKYLFDKKGGCIFNLFGDTKIHLDHIQVSKMNYLLENPISELNDLDKLTQNIISKLMQEGMGYFYDSNVYNEEYLENKEIEIRGLAEQVPIIETIFIQSTILCNGKCKFCINNNELIYGGCYSCKSWINRFENAISVDDETFLKIIRRVTGLMIKRIIFSGGNPFINWTRIQEFIEIIRQNTNSVEIKIISNGSYLNDDIFDYCLKNNVKLVFTVLGYDESSYVKITGSNSIYLDLIHAVDSCKRKNVLHEFSILAKSSDMLKINEFLINKRWNLLTTKTAEIYENNIPFQTVKCYNERKNNKVENYRRNKRYNSCLYGKLAINLYGHLKVCPMIEEVMADLLIEELAVPFQTLLIDKYWRMTKQQIFVCCECPYRFICEDCTAIEMAINSKKTGGSAICSRINSL